MRWRSPSFPLLLLFSFLTLLVRAATASELRICAHNVQRFNSVKASNYRVMHMLTRIPIRDIICGNKPNLQELKDPKDLPPVYQTPQDPPIGSVSMPAQIVARCDITLLQEVMDPDGKAIKKLVASLNRYSEKETDRYDEYTYQSVSSKSLGNSPSDMQQYVFIYRTETVNVTGQHQYQKKQSFAREPFAVQFQSKKTAIKKFILVPLHTDPKQAVQEIDRLYDVFEEVSKKWNNMNVMFLGDFHAGCAYMTRASKKNIRLFKNSKFSWLIGDKVDTTLSEETNCPYDRIVVYGQPLLKAIKPFSAKVFNFPKEFRITKTKAMELSDHLPVEVRLKSSALILQATPLLTLLSVSAIIQSFLSAL